MAYGNYWGGQWGGGNVNQVSTFDVTAATAILNVTVEVDFSEVLLDNAALLDPASYSIPGLIVTGVAKTGASQVTLITSSQSSGTTYTLTVVGDVLNIGLSPLDNNMASFGGISAAEAYVISNIRASAHCEGNRVDLTWTNPAGATFNKIVRRQKHWPFDLTDDHDVLYEGPALEEFIDSGVLSPQFAPTADLPVGTVNIPVPSVQAFSVGQTIRVERLQGPSYFELRVITAINGLFLRVAELENEYPAADSRVAPASTLRDTTFYYYTVLVTDSVSFPADDEWDFEDNSRVAGLSLRPMDSKETFFWKNTPREHRRLDSTSEAEGGGGGFLDQWYDVMGCWLNKMRGWTEAINTMADDDESPFDSLTAKNFSLGIDPDGFSYDFEIPRRTVLSLINVYKRRGTCPGIIRAVRMFTKWESECVEYGALLPSCRGGAKSLKTWDGSSETVELNFLLASNITQVPGTITYSVAHGGADGQFNDGALRGPIGEVVCVQTSTETEFTTVEAEAFHLLTNNLAAGATAVLVDDTTLLQPHMTVQLSRADGTAAEIVEINTITAGVSFTIKRPDGLQNSYSSGDAVSIERNVFRTELVGNGTWADIGGGQYTLTDPTARWMDGAWNGYEILDNGNTKHTVIQSDLNTITIAAGAQPPDGDYAVASDFALGASFAARDPMVRVIAYNGEHTFLLEPTYDVQLKGTRFDPFSPLYQGGAFGAALLGIYTSGDVGVLITSDVTQTLGITQNPSGAGNQFFLDPSSPAPTPNALVGMYLNPNQNQTQLFRILANDATSVTVAADVSSLTVPGQIYYVLNERDASRFQRLSARLGLPSREFAHQDINVRILFG